MSKRLCDCLPKEIIVENAFLKDYSTFGIGGTCVAVLEPRNSKELIACIKACEKLNLKFQVIGNGSNLLFNSKPCRRVFITTKKMARDIFLHENMVKCSCGVMISDLILWCKDRGLSGLENLYGIPATIGGMVMMNAGAFGVEIHDRLSEIEVYNKGKIVVIKACDIQTSRHYSKLLETSNIVLSATFRLDRLASSVIHSKIKEIAQERWSKQPAGKSAGSVFRNPEKMSAGKLIDDLGFKGVSIGGACVSSKHANFIINTGVATDKDVKQLIRIITNKVKKEYSIKLKREIEYIGDRDEIYR